MKRAFVKRWRANGRAPNLG